MEENKLVTLKLMGFNEASRNSFSAVLSLASRALKKNWQITEADEADFFLLSAQASATANRENLLKGRLAGRFLFCSTENITQKNELLVDDNHVPRLSVLVALFNKISASENSSALLKDAESSNQVSNVANSAALNSENFFDPQEGLLGHLLAAAHEQLSVSLNNQPEYPPLYIDTTKNAYYSKNTLEQLTPYLAGSAPLNIKPASKTEIENLSATEYLKPRPLKELIWYIVIKTSAGRLIKGHSTTSNIVALKSWPDLRLFKCLDYAKVAIFMKNNAAPLETIAAQTGMALAELNSFYNACYLMGLIEPRKQVEINQKTHSPEHLDLLNKIDERLK